MMRCVDLSATGSAGCTMPHASAMRTTSAVASGRAAAACAYTVMRTFESCLHSAPPRPTRSACRSSLSSLPRVAMPSSWDFLIISVTES